MNRQNESAVVITNWGYQGTSSPISKPQAATNRINATVVVKSDRPARPAAMEVDDLVAMFEQTPGDRKAMASARQWLGRTLKNREQDTLKVLRLAAGFSQTALAEAVGLQQPNISAIESGKRKPEYETAQKMARALNIAVEDVYSAFDNINRKRNDP